jgi:hypothetical protein
VRADDFQHRKDKVAIKEKMSRPYHDLGTQREIDLAFHDPRLPGVDEMGPVENPLNLEANLRETCNDAHCTKKNGNGDEKVEVKRTWTLDMRA